MAMTTEHWKHSPLLNHRKNTFSLEKHPDSHDPLPSTHYAFPESLEFHLHSLSFKFMQKSVYFEYTLSWSHEWTLGKVENIILKYCSLNFNMHTVDFTKMQILTQ